MTLNMNRPQLWFISSHCLRITDLVSQKACLKFSCKELVSVLCNNSTRNERRWIESTPSYSVWSVLANIDKLYRTIKLNHKCQTINTISHYCFQTWFWNQIQCELNNFLGNIKAWINTLFLPTTVKHIGVEKTIVRCEYLFSFFKLFM